MFNIQSNLSSPTPQSPTPQSLSGTQESSIVQTKTSKTFSTEESTARTQATDNRSSKTNSSSSESDSSDAIHQNNASSQDDLQNLGDSSNTSPNDGALASSISENQGGATAQAGFAAQFQAAETPFVNSSTLSKQATDYVSKSIQSKVALNSVTLKMHPTVQKGTSTQTVTILNQNGAPSLQEPAPMFIEPDRSEGNGNHADDTASSNNDPLSTTPVAARDTMNVFAWAESSAQLSTNSQLEAVNASISGSNANENIQLSDITNEQNKITQAIQDAKKEAAKNASAQKASNASVDSEWAVDAGMVVAGGLLMCTVAGAGLGAALIVGAALSMALMPPSGNDSMLNDLTKSLEGPPCYESAQNAEIISQVIIAVIIMAASMGAEESGMGDALNAAVRAGSVGARSTTDVASVGVSSTTDTAADSADASDDADAGYIADSSRSPVTKEDMVLTDGVKSTSKLRTMRILNAFGSSLARSATMGSRNAGKITAADVSKFLASGVYSAVTSPFLIAYNALDFLSSVTRGMMQFLYDCIVSISKVRTFEELSGMILENTKQGASFALAKFRESISQLMPRTIISFVFTAVATLNAFLNIYKAHVEEQALIAEGNFEQAQGEIKIDEAFVSEMQGFIESSNTALTNMLNTIEQEVSNTASTLSQMESPLETSLRS